MINFDSAKVLAIAIQQSLLLRANEVIKQPQQKRASTANVRTRPSCASPPRLRMTAFRKAPGWFWNGWKWPVRDSRLADAADRCLKHSGRPSAKGRCDSSSRRSARRGGGPDPTR